MHRTRPQKQFSKFDGNLSDSSYSSYSDSDFSDSDNSDAETEEAAAGKEEIKEAKGEEVTTTNTTDRGGSAVLSIQLFVDAQASLRPTKNCPFPKINAKARVCVWMVAFGVGLRDGWGEGGCRKSRAAWWRRVWLVAVLLLIHLSWMEGNDDALSPHLSRPIHRPLERNKCLISLASHYIHANAGHAGVQEVAEGPHARAEQGTSYCVERNVMLRW